MNPDAKKLKRDLKKAGLSAQAIDAAWPSWWSDEASKSKSAQAELRFTLARRLGLSPKSLTGDRVDFVWHDAARFKHLIREDEIEKAALTSFGFAIGRSILNGIDEGRGLDGISAGTLRSAILKNRRYVDLQGLIATCWSLGVPVVHLRVFPLEAKGMHAMVVKAGEQCAILLGRDANFPAPIAFTLAHEIAHIALNHLNGASGIVDLGDPADDDSDDPIEAEADKFALELLTGRQDPVIETEYEDFNAAQLADSALRTGPLVRIEPGCLALCVAYKTKNWAVANRSLRYIYTEAKPVWREVNRIAEGQLNWEQIGDDGAEYLSNVMAMSNEQSDSPDR